MATWSLEGDVLLTLNQDGSFFVKTTTGAETKISVEEAAALHVIRHHVKGGDGGAVAEERILGVLGQWGLSRAGPVMERLGERGIARATGALTQEERSRAPVFMVYCPRSGSNLLRWLLDSHPRFNCAATSPVMNQLIQFANHPWSAAAFRSLRTPKPWTRATLRRWVDEQLAGIAREQGKDRWCYRHWVSYRHLQFIDEFFDAKPLYLCLVRHGLDVADAASRVYAAGETWQAGPNGGDHDLFLESGGSYQLAYARFWREVSERMLEFRKVHPSRVYTLTYEGLVEEPDRILGELFAFLGEECPDELVAKAFKKPPKMLPAWSGHEVTRTTKIEKGRSGRWREWSPDLKRAAAAIVNPPLSAWGYDPVLCD